MSASQTVRFASRLFDLVNLIVTNPKLYTAPRLAEHFHVSVRTIRRDIRLIEDLGIRVESEPGGGYFIMRDLQRIPGILTEDERAVLDIMPALLYASLPHGRVHPLVDTYRRAVEKLLPEKSLPARQVADESLSTEGRIIADLSRSPHQTDDRLLFKILFAIRTCRILEMDYVKIGASAPETRMVNPYYLVPWHNSLYLIGFCHLRQAFRTFKILRIRRAKCFAQTFERDARFSLGEFLKSAWGIDQSGPRVEVHVRFAPLVAHYAQEDVRRHSILREVYLADGSYEVWFRVHWNWEFLRFVLQYGSGVEVLEPLEVRDQVREEILRMSGLYKKIDEAPQGVT
ncbi:WYL domain-containing protein [Kyrpidia sp.]|uniref:helix-turn-helix transcriptional regulator n=1 Tax=Kyrpidia sp. TaxID=2073077 RepID=UPI0025866326|nr:WYL domain-containing protein [Kyrpidia sp.]MCL6576739.1 WYL domain-containing protein [Kyrpidia sp.]